MWIGALCPIVRYGYSEYFEILSQPDIRAIPPPDDVVVTDGRGTLDVRVTDYVIFVQSLAVEIEVVV